MILLEYGVSSKIIYTLSKTELLQIMKAIDLRIGNVYRSVKYDRPLTLTAEDIYELVLTAEFGSVDDYIEEMFRPIEITERWLIRAGFVWNNARTELKLNNIYAVLHYETQELRIFYFTHALKNVKYVHELQSLHYEFEKTELEIETEF